MTKIISLTIMTLVTPKARVKHEHLFYKPASDDQNSDLHLDAVPLFLFVVASSKEAKASTATAH